MQKRTLGKTNLSVSAVGFGGIPIQGVSGDDVTRLVHGALDRGIDFFDTARGYTDSEEKLGRALAGRRAGVVLATKSLARDRAGMEQDLATSLANLRTDHIDLYQIHAVASREDLARILAPGGCYEALDAARAAGRIGHIGVTGHSRPVLLEAVRSGRFATVQFPFNPLEPEAAEDLLPEARAAGLGTICMKPLAGGALSRLAVLALRFELAAGLDVVIPGIDEPGQLDEAAAAGDDPRPLTAQELAAFDEERRRWVGRFCHRCGYCLPCPNGLNIPFLFLIEGYYTRYELEDWARARLRGLPKTYADCRACGECVARCPYELPIPELLAQAGRTIVP